MSAVSPTIISIETSSNVGSVAVHQAGNLIGSIEQHVRNFHHQTLTKMVQSVLTVCNITLEQVAAVAIGEGPGSYTGMRIGSSFAKGICYSRNIPLIAINTLKTLLQISNNYIEQKGLWCALIDARHSRAYALLQDQCENKLLTTQVVRVEEATFIHWLRKQIVTFIGNGADHYAHALLRNSNSSIIRGHYPKAQDMGKLAYESFMKKNWQDLANFQPLYLRSELLPSGLGTS
ncbi:MAG: tRNA (adenosine(37)-N6)-threonylcarbamoyltransferase complex dimerization subunit type 1 TsaB [Bacteroidota bacterium]